MNPQKIKTIKLMKNKIGEMMIKPQHEANIDKITGIIRSKMFCFVSSVRKMHGYIANSVTATTSKTNASSDVSSREAKQIVPNMAALNDIARETRAAGIP